MACVRACAFACSPSLLLHLLYAHILALALLCKIQRFT